MDQILLYTHNLLTGIGLSPTPVKILSALSLMIVWSSLLYALYLVLARLIEPWIYWITRRTDIKWDDIVFRHKALRWIWILLILLLAYFVVPPSLGDYPSAVSFVKSMLRIMLILCIMMTVIEGVRSVFLLIGDRDNIDKIVEQMHDAVDNEREFVYLPSHSLKGLQQMITIIIMGISAVLVISTLLGKDPVIVFSGLSAMAAVLMLVFQDSILGMVAGVQITANDMLQPGDWIMAPKYGANGIVKEVTLAAVKVQNWDKTIITIPPYRLLTEGFQNWRGMLMSKGRRVMRSINIDLTSIRFATKEEVDRWRCQKWWASDHNPKRRIVNLSAFRMYLEHYITEIPTFVPNMLFMVRELQPTAEGLPVEIYFFTSKTSWKSYEAVQADVIDQVLAVVHEFGLRVYQRPSGTITLQQAPEEGSVKRDRL